MVIFTSQESEWALEDETPIGKSIILATITFAHPAFLAMKTKFTFFLNVPK